MDQASGSVGGSSLTFLSLVREVAADAAAQSDPDTSLRHLRSGLIRLGFSRAGIWVTDRENPALLRGTWGTDWDGSEIDEHHLAQLAADFHGAPGILRGEPVVTEHVARGDDPRLPVQFTKLSPGDQPNYACVALRAEGHLIGIMSIDMIPSDRILDLQQIPALELLADLIAVVLARGRTTHELNAANDELRAANVALRESETRYRAVSELASDFTYGVRVLEDGSMAIEWITDSAERITGFPSDLDRDIGPVPFTIHPGDAAVVQKHFQSVRSGRTTATEFRILPRAGETRWLHLTSRPERDAEQREVVRIYSAAKDITEQKQAVTEAERLEKRAEFLAEASRQFSTAHDAWSTLQSFARLVVPTIADWCLVDLVSSSGSIQRFTVFHADERRVEEARERDRRHPIDLQSSRVSARVIRTGQSELVADGPDAFLDPDAYDERDLAGLVDEPISSVMFVPLAAPGHAFGVITLVAAESGRHFGSLDLALVEELASRSAIAIDNVRLFEAERQARAAADRAHQEITALYEATKQITTSFDLATTLGSILEAVITLSGSSTAGIALLDASGTTLTIEAGRGQYAEILQGMRLDGTGVTGTVAASGEVFISLDLLRDARWHPAPGMPPEAIRAGLFVPLKVRDQVIGVLSAWSDQVGYFTPTHDRLLRGFSEQAALAVDRARDIARRNQADDERKHSEEALRRSEQYFRLLIERATDVILVLNSDGTIRYASPYCEVVFGQSPDALAERDVRELVHPDNFVEVSEMLSKIASSSGVGYSFGFRGRHADGTWRLIDATGINFLGEAAVSGIVVSLRDITERLLLEEQLRQAQKMEAVGQLAGGVAHDFNNLLTVICGYGEILLEQLDPARPEFEEVKQIVQAAESAASLTRQLLAFSRRQLITLQETDLNAVVEQVSKMLHRLIGEDITFATVLTPNLKPARVDAGQIEQILLNLATNARDAMPHGGKLTIETHNVELGEADVRQHPGVRIGPHVMIDVRDTGTGMDEATKAHIFEPFFTTKEVGRGTGLGLAAVYGIVQQSGGFVDVSSDVGRGTSFKIYFPDATPEPLPVLSHEPVARLFRGTETILLVEDEERVRDLARAALEGAGYRVLESAGGESALRLVADTAQPIDLLVTDVVMPGLNGRQLAERLVEPYPAMKVLYVSGYTFDLVVRHGVFESGVAFLQKPFTPSTLTRKVREVLDIPGP